MIRTLTLALCAIAGLTGCVPLLIGGAAAGGYYIGQDDRSGGVPPKRLRHVRKDEIPTV